MYDNIEYKGYRIEIETDDNAMDPRDINFTDGNIGKMICFHKRYRLGDKHDYDSRDFESWEELRRDLERREDPAIILPLYMMDHSGITISCTNTTFRACDPQGWDWGQIGFIIARKDRIREVLNVKYVGPRLKEKVEHMLISEVEIYDQYLTGDVYGYRIFKIDDEDEEEIDSCWGYYGDTACMEEAKAQVDQYVKNKEAA